MVTPCHKFRFDFYRCYYFLGESPRISAGSGYPRLSVLLRRSADRTRPSAGRSYPFPGQRAGPVETLHLEERKARRNPAKGSEQRLIQNLTKGGATSHPQNQQQKSPVETRHALSLSPTLSHSNTPVSLPRASPCRSHWRRRALPRCEVIGSGILLTG